MRHRFRREDVDIGRQFVVQPSPQRLRRKGGDDVEVGDLCQRVDAGIGASGSVQLEIPTARDRAHRAVDLPLNRPRVLLDLPAAVTRAGVLDGQLEAHCVSP